MILLAVIQGISEWFPISSSGHIVLFSKFFDFANSISFDVALHFGTLMAVFVYFGQDIVNIIEDILKGKWQSENSKLGFMIIIASIPAAIAGFLLKSVFESAFSSLLVVFFGFAITSLLLFIVSFSGKKSGKSIPRQKDSWIIGIAQAFAILPGISRSGATISAGLLSGLNEKSAMKFSFLLAIPAIFGASILELGNQTLPREFIIPTLISFVVGMLTIHLLLKFISKDRKNFIWFAIYDLVIALVTLGYVLLN